MNYKVREEGNGPDFVLDVVSPRWRSSTPAFPWWSLRGSSWNHRVFVDLRRW